MLKTILVTQRDRSVSDTLVFNLPCHSDEAGCQADCREDIVHEVHLEGMLRLSGRCVVQCNLNADYVYKAWQFPLETTTQVLQAAWAEFNSRQEQWLAILVNKRFLALYCGNGSQIDVSLPYAVDSIWPFHRGLLLQCADCPHQQSSFLMLTHPHGEVKPVGDRWTVYEHVVYLQQDTMVSYGNGAHSFWHMAFNERVGDEGDVEVVRDAVDSVAATEPLPKSKLCFSSRLVDGVSETSVPVRDVDQRSGVLWTDIGLFRRVHQCTPSVVASSVFHATDLGVKLLCLVVSNTLVAYAENFEVAFKLSYCLDAAPIIATNDKDVVDIVILRQDHTLHLQRGILCVAQLFLPGTDMCLSHTAPSGTAHTKADCWQAIENMTPLQPRVYGVVVQIKHAVGSRLTLCMCPSEGCCLEVRVEVVFRTTHPIVRSCLSVLEKQLLPHHAITICCATVQAHSDPWTVFTETVRSLLGFNAKSERVSLSAWHELLSSDYHAASSARLQVLLPRDDAQVGACGQGIECYYDSVTAESRTACEISRAALRNIAALNYTVPSLNPKQVVKWLHYVFEEFKLSLLTWRFVRPLGIFLAGINTEQEYASRLRRDVVGISLAEPDNDLSPSVLASDVHEWLSATMRHGSPPYKLETLSIPGQLERAQFLSVAFSNSIDTNQAGCQSHASHLVSVMVQNGFDAAEILTWPPGIALPLHDALLKCRPSPPQDWPAAAYVLIGRSDLALLQDSCCFQSVLSHRLAVNILSGPRPNQPTRPILNPDFSGVSRLVDGDVDEQSWQCDSHLHHDAGVRFLRELAYLQYGDDWRVREAYRLLDSEGPVSLRMARPPEVCDHQFEQDKQARLLLYCIRSSAAPCGRAMLSLASLPRQTLTEALPIPALNKQGRIPQLSATVELDASYIGKLGIWPSFHNGVAAGLCLKSNASSSFSGLAEFHQHQAVSRNWIVYNRQDTPSPQHGGLLLALGLQRHLDVLVMTDLYEYLTLSDDPTTVGVLLGMAVCKRGSADAAVSKMLCLHLPALLPQPFAEMDVSPPAQAAALVGVGLLYQSTANRLMAEFLLGQVSKPICHDRTCARESYSLAAGLGLGFVLLGMGASVKAAGLSDLHIAERLHHAMTGGRKSFRSPGKSGITNPTLLCKCDFDHSAATLLLSDDFLGHGDTFRHQSRTRSSHGSSCLMRSSRVCEGNHVNTDVTAPGAILAHGLYFMCSNSQSAAQCLKLPDTQVLLDAMRPDFIMLRVISHALILWDAVVPSQQWVRDQVPDAVMEAIAILKMRCGTSSILANSPCSRPIDCNTIRQVHAHVIVASCFVLGVRFAGTMCRLAIRTLRYYLMYFSSLRATFPTNKTHACGASDCHVPSLGCRRATDDLMSVYAYDTVPAAFPMLEKSEAKISRPNRPTVEMCLGVIALALGMVLAGTGDLDMLRELRQLRRRIDGDVSYGTHQAIHMAIGLLFLGGGQASLSRSKASVAALITAFFPRFPVGPDDNQYHLQPLRHLWVLAVEWRGLKVVDVDHLGIVPATVRLTLIDAVDWATAGEILEVRAPCLLPPLSDIAFLEIAAVDYFPVRLNPAENEAHSHSLRQLILYAKRCVSTRASSKLSRMSLYPRLATFGLEEPQHPLFCSWKGEGRSERGNRPMEIQALLTNEAWLQMFVNLFCKEIVPQIDGQHGLQPMCIMPGSTFATASARLFMECTSNNRPDILPVYVQLYHYTRQLVSSAETLQAWSLRLSLDYLDNRSRLRQRLSDTSLINVDFVAAMQEQLSRSLRTEQMLRGFSHSLKHKRLLRSCQRILRATLVT